VEAERFERIVLYSTQWLSVLGTSFQAQEEPRGIHVDENWYELGDLPFHFKCDSALSRRFADAVKGKGLPAKTVDYDGFPIDTGTIVAMKFLNPDGKIPVSLVSSWVYATPETSFTIGAEVKKTICQQGHKTLFVASSLLSSRFLTKEIDPEADAFAVRADDEWNRKVLAHWEAGDWSGLKAYAAQFAKEARADMQFNAFHWLNGILEDKSVRGRVSHYGPLWGTGAAVVEFYVD